MSKNYFREWEQYKRQHNIESGVSYSAFKEWKEYQKWQRKNAWDIRSIKMKNGKEVSQKIKSFDEFAAIFRESKGDVQRIKDEVRFFSSEETANAFIKSYKDVKGESLDISIHDIRKKSTRQLAELINDDIKDFRKAQVDELMKQGLSQTDASRMAGLMVSHYFFGS